MAEEIKDPGFVVQCSSCGWNSRHQCHAEAEHMQHVRQALYDVLGELGVMRAQIDGALESFTQRLRTAERKLDFERRESMIRSHSQTVPATSDMADAIPEWPPRYGKIG